MGGLRLYKVGSPYNYSELFDLDYAQSFDTMYLCHVDHQVNKLTREGHAEWLFTSVTFGPTIAAPTSVVAAETNPNVDADNAGNAYFPQPASYVVSAINEDTGQESRASTSDSATNDLGLKRNYNTVTWAAVTGATLYAIYKSNNTGSYGYIGETSGLSFVDDNILPDLSDAPVVADNPFDGTGNYPGKVCFFEQRLFFGRTRNRPNAIFATRSADFENMDKARPLQPDDALSLAASSGKVNAITQLVPASNLLVLTTDSIFQVVGANDDYVSPSPPPKIRRQNGRGVSDLKALLIDAVTFFQPRIGTEVRALGFSFEIDGFSSNDMSVFSSHLFENNRIIDWAFAEEPMSIIWCVRDDGALLAFTWQQEQQVWGWTRQNIDGQVLTVCAVPELGEDRLYMLVKRTFNGVDRYFAERMASFKWTDFKEACYLDCAVTQVFEAPTATIGKLFHLEGQEVWALADGFPVKGLTVENATVTLPDTASNVTVGLPMTALVETLPLNFNGPKGASQGTKQTTGFAHLNIVDTLGITAGRTDDKQEDVTTRDQESLGTQANLHTGLVRVQMEQAVRFETTVVIRQDNPLPLTLAAAYIEADAS